ncbi:cytochrome P450 [Lentzea sp. BCCO 10_0061]|uniref:Cytochrome P450 n=1 Tax=Lentzea sokolovensis TaxID=3095429 RepID=A0ABU4UPF8_9PSEU|nr:cytochrome P450 [Lentzea sp. BCCO 10_0061]MDX8141370.1 cytochrome P450 [Lentzea sp. BCCO 10_0061]
MTAPHRVPRAMRSRVPLIGSAIHLRRDPLGFVQEIRRSGDVATFKLGPRTVYVVNHPELIRQMLVTEADKFHKGVMFEKARILARNGLFTSEGDFHTRQRRLIQPAVRASEIAGYTRTMREQVDELVTAWADGDVVRMDQATFPLALGIVTRVLFSTDLDPATAAEVHETLPVLLRGLGQRALAPFDFLDRLPTPTNRAFDRALPRFRSVIHRLIREHRLDLGQHPDLLTSLLQAADPDTGETMSDEQVYDEVTSMIIAGSETTSAAMAWAAYLLATHPDVQRAVQAEVDEVLQGRPVRYEDLGRLQFTHRVVKETLRLYPTTWMLMRRPLEDVDLGGYRIPADAMVLFSIFALHRDPALFPDPERFDPDRWLPDRARTMPPHAYLPFGAGPRGCIGGAFSHTEAAVFLATLAQRHTLVSVSDEPVRIVTTLIPMPGPISLGVRSRAGSRSPEAVIR